MWLLSDILEIRFRLRCEAMPHQRGRGGTFGGDSAAEPLFDFFSEPIGSHGLRRLCMWPHVAIIH
jgi:hypothetical protein